MIFSDFEIRATPFIRDAFCKDCDTQLIQVSHGALSAAMFCKRCKNVYVLKLIKLSKHKVTAEFLKQAEKEVKEKQDGKTKNHYNGLLEY